MRVLKVLAILLGIVVLIPIVRVAYFFYAGGMFTCTSSIISETPSPGRLRNVVVYEQNCGATTPVAVHVGISQSLDEFGDDVLVIEARSGLQIEWYGEDRVVISHDTHVGSEQVFLKRDSLDHMTVNYENIDDPPIRGGGVKD